MGVGEGEVKVIKWYNTGQPRCGATYPSTVQSPRLMRLRSLHGNHLSCPCCHFGQWPCRRACNRAESIARRPCARNPAVAVCRLKGKEEHGCRDETDRADGKEIRMRTVDAWYAIRECHGHHHQSG